MTQRIINNGDSGLTVRTALNDNFAETAYLDVANQWTKAQHSPSYVTTAAGVTVLNMGTYNNFIITLNDDVSFDNPTTEIIGQTGFIVLQQDATGGRVVTWGTEFKNPDGVAPVLSTEPNSIDMIGYCVLGQDSILLGAPLLAFA